MESIAIWQGATLCGIVTWILMASYLNLTPKLRSLLQPWVAHHVITGTPLVLQIQVSHTMMILLIQFCVFPFFLFHWEVGFRLEFCCRITSIASWMLSSLLCPVLFLCPFTLPFFLCFSGYVLQCSFFIVRLLLCQLCVLWLLHRYAFWLVLCVALGWPFVEWAWQIGKANDPFDGFLWLLGELYKGNQSPPYCLVSWFAYMLRVSSYIFSVFVSW